MAKLAPLTSANIHLGKDRAGKWSYRIIRNGKTIHRSPIKAGVEAFIRGWNEQCDKPEAMPAQAV